MDVHVTYTRTIRIMGITIYRRARRVRSTYVALEV